MSKIELLAPAGNLEKAKIALLYGADAVYIGGKQFSLRARASNFDLKEIKELVEFAHERNKLVYVTMNIIPHDSDLAGLKEYLINLETIGVDAIIVSSLYIIEQAKLWAPKLAVHLSTQKSTTSVNSVKYYQNKGVERVVLAREVTLEEMTYISKNTEIELEVFIHGGMCASYSGHCVLSNHMTNRDANRGGCAHSCRWNYSLVKNGEKQEKFFNFGSKDLMAIKYIPQLIDLGIASLKIEGRMKSMYYLACVVRAYRMLIDHYIEFGSVSDEYYQFIDSEIRKAENRLTNVGFYNGIPDVDGQLYDNRSEIPTQEFAGFVLGNVDEYALIEQRNYFIVGDTLEVISPNMENRRFKVEKMFDYETKESLDVARHPLQKILIECPFSLKPNDFIRKV